MPHQIVEYSANLDGRVEIQELVNTLHLAAVDSGVFPVAGIRTRAVRREHYRVADGHPDNAFVNVYLRVAPRPQELRDQASQAIFGALCGFLKPLYESSPLAISFELQQLEPDRLRQNNLRRYMAERGESDTNL